MATDGELLELRASVDRFLADRRTFAERRVVIESEPGWDPALWRAMAEQLDVLGLVADGTTSNGPSAVWWEPVVVVAEALGRHLAPEPFVECAVEAASLLSSSSTPRSQTLLAAIATGERVAVVAWDNTVESSTVPDGIRLSGHAPVVLAGPWADVVVVPVRSDRFGAAAVVVVDIDTDGVDIEWLATIDGRRAAAISFDVTVPQDAVVESGTAALEAIDRAMLAGDLARCAVAVGLMDRAVSDTFEYIAERRQFGAPISSFQAVSHRAVDMRIEASLARAALAAAIPLVGDPLDHLAIDAATIVTKQAARIVGQGAVQLFGGMGMANETPISHAFRSLTALEHHRGTAARVAARFAAGLGYAPHGSNPRRTDSRRGGVHPAIATPELDDFRAEIRSFLATNLTDELRHAGHRMTSVYTTHASTIAWQRILDSHGWGAPGWPAAAGGCGWSVPQRYVYQEESLRAGAPPTPLGLGMVGHAIIAFGTAEQRERFLEPMRRGDHHWCQGYSESQAGSDLAALQMSGVVDGDELVINGSKLWSTHAHTSNWVFALVRTNREGRPQEGMTFVLVDMASSGVSVAPTVMLSGEHIQNEIVFDDVRVPLANVVGEIDRGWTVAKYLLEFERGGSAYGPEIAVQVDALVADLRERAQRGEPTVLTDSVFVTELALATARLAAMRSFELDAMDGVSSPGIDASIMKIVGTELRQRVTELALWAAGQAGLVFQPAHLAPGGEVVTPHNQAAALVGSVEVARAGIRYLNDRAGSIYAGSNEIQRNILAKALTPKA